MHINLPPEHPIISFETIEIKMAAVSLSLSSVNWILVARYYVFVLSYRDHPGCQGILFPWSETTLREISRGVVSDHGKNIPLAPMMFNN